MIVKEFSTRRAAILYVEKFAYGRRVSKVKPLLIKQIDENTWGVDNPDIKSLPLGHPPIRVESSTRSVVRYIKVKSDSFEKNKKIYTVTEVDGKLVGCDCYRNARAREWCKHLKREEEKRRKQ